MIKHHKPRANIVIIAKAMPAGSRVPAAAGDAAGGMGAARGSRYAGVRAGLSPPKIFSLKNIHKLSSI